VFCYDITMETIKPAPQEAPLPPLEEVLTPATIGDVSEITRVMEEARELKQSQGDDLWGDKPFTEQEITGMIEAGTMFTYRVGGTVAASVILLKNDERMWGADQGTDGSARYVHKISRGKDFKGVGEKAMRLAEDLARSEGRTKLRLDCPYDNPRLYNYYEELGFHEVRRYDRPASPGRRNPDKDVFKAALLEKNLAGSSPTQ
jgi:ribosomal protein S18 acetylase RimI-like enzyme